TNELSVFPNPASDHLILEFKTPMSEPFQVMLTDAVGKLVLVKNYNFTDGQSQLLIDVSYLPAGFYSLKAKSESMLNIIKVVVQK
ncbi:MAG: T9SS type A sorting domain-containing protein, partial [Chitinophagales bacterium]|nr:T9SS type A sorting domain-containing protein [Chitinophagales bacterium]